MSNLKFKLNSAGVRALLKSKEMSAVLNQIGDNILNKCGENGYEKTLYIGKNRANVSIKASTKKAIKDNLKNNTLLKAVQK